jgi:TRAP-type C4-dicarboxylate transport system permease small subunit
MHSTGSKSISPGTIRIYDAIEAFFNSISIWLLMGIMFLIVVEITLRAITSKSIPGGYEVVELALGAICFLAISYTQKQRGHVRMDLVLIRLPQKARYICEFVALLLSLIICTVILSQTIVQTRLAIEMNLFTPGVVSYPLWPTRLALSIGFFLVCIRIILQMIDMLIHGSKKPQT